VERSHLKVRPTASEEAEYKLRLLRELHRLISVKLSGLILERATINADLQSPMRRLERVDLLVKRWTIDDAIETLEERRVELERDYEDLTRAFSRAANLRRDLAPEGRYYESFQEAEDRLINVQRRMDEAQFRLRGFERQINTLTSTRQPKSN